MFIDYVVYRCIQPRGQVPAGTQPRASLFGPGDARVDRHLRRVGRSAVLNTLTTISIGQGMVNDLRSRVYHHLQRLSLSYHSRGRSVTYLRVTARQLPIQTLAIPAHSPIVSAVVLLVRHVPGMFRLDDAPAVAMAVCSGCCSSPRAAQPPPITPVARHRRRE